MKILLVIHDPGEGGMWQVADRLASAFMQAGITVRVAMLSNGPYEICTRDTPYTLDILPPRDVRGFRKLIKKYNPDILVPFDVRLHVCTLLSAWGLGKIVIAGDHTGYLARRLYELLQARRSSLLQTIFFRFIAFFALTRGILLYQFYRLADCVVSPSQDNKQLLTRYTRLPAKQIIHIPNPLIDTTAARPLAWQPDSAQPYFLNVGRRSYYKGYDVLLHAFKCVREKHPVKLVLLGGLDKNAISEMAQRLGVADAIEMPGFTKNVGEYMRRATALVLASRYEVLSNVMIEALYEGTPVIATDCHSGPAEVLDNGRYGRLVPVDDADAMARAMFEALAGLSPATPEQRRKRAEPYAISVSAEQYIHLLQSCLHK